MSDNEMPQGASRRAPAVRAARVGGIAAIVAGILNAVGVTIIHVGARISYAQANVELQGGSFGLILVILSAVAYVASGLLALRGALKVAPWLVIPSILISALLFLGSTGAQLFLDTLGFYWVAIAMYGLSGVVGLVSLIFLLIAFTRRPRPVTPPTIRNCPHCAETIKIEAKVCRHCGRDITPTITPDA